MPPQNPFCFWQCTSTRTWNLDTLPVCLYLFRFTLYVAPKPTAGAKFPPQAHKTCDTAKATLCAYCTKSYHSSGHCPLRSNLSTRDKKNTRSSYHQAKRMGCGFSSENDRNATNLGDPNNYREEDAEAATAAFASRQGLGSRVTANVWCKDLRWTLYSLACGYSRYDIQQAVVAHSIICNSQQSATTSTTSTTVLLQWQRTSAKSSRPVALAVHACGMLLLHSSAGVVESVVVGVVGCKIRSLLSCHLHLFSSRGSLLDFCFRFCFLFLFLFLPFLSVRPKASVMFLLSWAAWSALYMPMVRISVVFSLWVRVCAVSFPVLVLETVKLWYASTGSFLWIWLVILNFGILGK